MSFQQGEVYRCPEGTCGCEVTVTKGASASCEGHKNPTCCCGRTMEFD